MGSSTEIATGSEELGVRACPPISSTESTWRKTPFDKNRMTAITETIPNAGSRKRRGVFEGDVWLGRGSEAIRRMISRTPSSLSGLAWSRLRSDAASLLKDATKRSSSFPWGRFLRIEISLAIIAAYLRHVPLVRKFPSRPSPQTACGLETA